MLPELRVLKFHPYFLPESGTELEHSGRTHMRDWQAYHLPWAAFHHAYLHGRGIVYGFEVAIATGNPQSLVVQPGVAIDQGGQLIILSGQRESRAYIGPTQEEIASPYVISTADLTAAQQYYLTVRVTTELNDQDQKISLPWFEFWTFEDPASALTQGAALVLALVMLDDGGNITKLESLSPTAAHRRHMLIGAGVEALQIQRSSAMAGMVRNQCVAQLLAGDTGELRVTMTDADAELLVAHEQGGNFRHLAVHANTMSINGSVGIGTPAPPDGLHVTGRLQVTGDIQSSGSLTVDGPAAVAAELTIIGNIQGRGELQIVGVADLLGGITTPSLRVTGDATVDGNLSVSGTVAGRNLDNDGKALDTHLLDHGNPHVVTAAQIGALALGGGSLSGDLRMTGRLAVGTTSITQTLDVAGQGCFHSAQWKGPAEGIAGLTAGFDESNGGGTGFLLAHDPNRRATRLWLDGDPILFAPHAEVRMSITDQTVAINNDLHVAGKITGQLTSINVDPSHQVRLPCADLIIGGVPGRGPQRRALVAWERSLEINHNGDWPEVVIRNMANGSSRNYKRDIHHLSLQTAQRIFATLAPVEFSMNTDPMHRIRPGFIAEESDKLVVTSDQKAIFMDSILAVLTKIVQQQSQEIALLQSEIRRISDGI